MLNCAALRDSLLKGITGEAFDREMNRPRRLRKKRLLNIKSAISQIAAIRVANALKFLGLKDEYSGS